MSNTGSDLAIQRLERLRQGLTESTGCEVEVWNRVEEWATAGKPASPALKEVLENVWDAGEAALHSPDDARQVFAPLGNEDYPTVASMPACGEAETLSLRLLQSSVRGLEAENRIDDLMSEIDCFAQQVTCDFEELTFLRRIPDVLDVSEQSGDLVAVARAVLSSLLHLIDAECIGFVFTHLEASGDHNQLVNWVGKPLFGDFTTWSLIRQYGPSAMHLPYVRNHFFRAEESAAFPGLSEFILVPVCRADRLMGWLFALNRASEFEADVNDTRTWEAIQREFGTSEATLLSSTASILATHASNIEHIQEKENLLTSIVRVMVSAIEAKDKYTCGHSERVALYGRRLAEELGYEHEDCERLYLTGLLHDIGKIGISDAILTKPDRLTDEEFEEIKKHPDKGWSILQVLDQMKYVLPGVLFHHERIDGRGYPDGLTGDRIPIDGRILAVADAYDAMTSDRPYRQGMPQERAEKILREGAGSQWDSLVIDAMFRAMKDIVAIRNTYQQKPEPVRTAELTRAMPTALPPIPGASGTDSRSEAAELLR